MNVLLTHGYFLEEDEKEQAIMKPYPPLGILSVSAWLRERGWDVDLFDSTFSSFDRLLSRVLSGSYQVVGIYANLMTRPRVVDLIRSIREHRPSVPVRIVLGGPEVTYHVEQFLQVGADVIVIGEGEETMDQLLRAWSSDLELKEVDGIAYLNETGSVQRTRPRTLKRNVDELPIPDRDRIDLSLYLAAWKERHGMNAVSVNTMRGCPYTCRWCSRAVFGQSYRRRSPEVVVRELEHIGKQYGPDLIWFVDDVFTISPKWLRRFDAAVRESGINQRYECITRADRMDEETVRLLKSSGCFRVWIGAESGSQRVIDAMDRRVKVEQVQRMIQQCKEAGIEAGTFIMLGYPGETETDIEATIEHLKKSKPDLYTITTAYPITGTEFHSEVQDLMTNAPNWEDSTDRDLNFRRTYPERYYRYALRRLHNEVEASRVPWNLRNAVRKSELLAKAGVAKIAMRLIRGGRPA